jgi:hypothetical protein
MVTRESSKFGGRVCALVLMWTVLGTSTALAQMPPRNNDQAQMQMPPDEGGHARMHMPASPGPLQFSSGTSWQPSSTPDFMWMTSSHGWMLMAHGELVLAYNQQGGPRGVGKAQSSNWAMFMEERKVGRGTLRFRQMFSAEPLTAPHPGFPNLFQTGETYKGNPLVDYQHPHDVFGELSLQFVYPISERVSWMVYGGPAGEPALGPTAFLHRVSAMENPSAPLSHHLQDSTHISYGVVTTGFLLGPVKLEGSAFNGREPDERRYNFDLGALDSWSARASVALSKSWVAQYSYGHLVHPEALESGNTERQTASLEYNRLTKNGYWANSLIWGRNHKQSGVPITNSYLFESSLNFAEKNYVFGRIELVDKDELDLLGALAGRSFRIGAYSFGAVRDLVHNDRGQIGIGADLSFYSKPEVLTPVYGANPVSFEIFLRFRPGRMQM